MTKIYECPAVEEISTFTEGPLCFSTGNFESTMENVGREDFEW